jgi:ATP adenylyltransferase
MDVVGCLGCDLYAGRRFLAGGIVHQTAAWVVTHVVGPMNIGTLVLGPKDHVVAVADLDDAAAAELGPLMRATARVVESLCKPEQTYMSLWSHAERARKHLHIVVQPVTTEVIARYGGLRSEQLQARMLASGDASDAADIEKFCDQARDLFAGIVADS